jgi:photoactive yellow protein
MKPTVAEALAIADGGTSEEVDQLPFGMIQLDFEGNILSYNEAEATFAKLNKTKQIGRNFFDSVAPCTKVKDFYGRFLEGIQNKKLYETFGFVFKFSHGWKNVAITMMLSEKSDSVWVLVSQQPANEPPSQLKTS